MGTSGDVNKDESTFNQRKRDVVKGAPIAGWSGWYMYRVELEVRMNGDADVKQNNNRITSTSWYNEADVQETPSRNKSAVFQ